MKNVFLRIFLLVSCAFPFIFFGCDNQQDDTTPVEGISDTFDQTKDIQKNLSAEAQRTVDALTNAQQVPRAIESLDTQQSEKTAKVPGLDAN